MAISSLSARCAAGLALALLVPVLAKQEQCTEEQCTELQGAEAEEAVDAQIDDLQLLQVDVQLKDLNGAHATRLQPRFAGGASKQQSDMATEYMPLAATDQCDDIQNCPENRLQWMKLTYPAQHFDSVDDVTWSSAHGDPALGKWDDMPLGATGLTLTMRLDGKDERASKAYGLINDFRLGLSGTSITHTFGESGNPGGCCATVMRVYDKSTGAFVDFDVLAAVREALDDQPVKWASASHAFHLDRIDGTLYAFLIVQYVVNQTQDNLGDVYLDAIVCLNMDDGKTIKRTQAGLKYFSIFDNLGTFGDDSVYKIRFVNNVTTHPEQYHLNSISRFTTVDGTAVLALSTIYDNEVVLLRDPWTYSTAERGGEILQRFGNPGWGYSAAEGVPRRHFGFPSSEGNMLGIHGAQYYRQTDGTEWMTFFNNAFLGVGQAESTTTNIMDLIKNENNYESAGWRFQVKLAPESEASCGERCGEEVFATRYHAKRLGDYSFSQGGCRPVGNRYGSTGVLMCSTLLFGPVLYDDHGGVKHADEFTSMYDPGAYFELSE